ncbi:hypothetical protein Tco_1196379 [Tanacetum coccineum]
MKMVMFSKGDGHVVLTNLEDEDAENSSKNGRNLQEEGLDEMVRNLINQEKDEKQSQKRQKRNSEGKRTVKDKAKSKPESQSSQKVNRKVNWSKSKSTPGPKSKKYKFRG